LRHDRRDRHLDRADLRRDRREGHHCRGERHRDTHHNGGRLARR
jgi:hypothetical protein